jgi:replicative DNA helicase
MRRALVELGLAGKRSEDKFIPEAYKWASPSDRLEMLRGLMDTDGSAQVQYKEGREIPARTLEFCSVSSQLAEDVAFLVRSLGGVAKIKRSSAGYRKDGVYKRCLDRYRVRVSFAADINPFRLQRKAEQCIRKSPPRRRIVSIEPAGRAECQCITVDSPSKLYMTNDFIVTHNTMLASQMLANMADREVNCLFLSLEQGAGSFYPRLACQALDMPVEDVEEFIKTGAPELEKVHQLYKNMLLVDNVPTETTEAVTMTPGKVQSIIQEANLTHFEGRPIDVVIIDHLGILEVGADAPGDIMKSETAAPGWIMKELFKVCKSTRVFMIVLQQLPKQVPAGVPFAYDAGWGGSAQTNFSDYVLQIWRPEQAEGLDDTARLEVEGQYKIALGKNRYGPGALGHYFFDKTTLRILPPLRINQPKATGLDGDEEIMFFSPENEMPVDGGESFRPSEAGATEASLQALVAATPDIVPRDNQALLDALGAVEDEEDSLDDVFGEAGLGEDLSD